MKMEFSGKVVLITGACSGIGARTAVEFSARGAELAMTGLGSQGPVPGLFLTSDLSKDEQVHEVFTRTMSSYGRIDVLVNCAGVLESGSVENSSPEQLRRVLEINLKSAYYLTTLCAKVLSETSGCIVNVSSVTGLRAFPDVAAYCISKAALDQLTRVSALELASKGVRVNSVNPGVINTDIYVRSGMTNEQVDKFFENSKKCHALGRPGTTEEVAKVVAFLATSHASFITGVCLPVDGGRHLICPR